MIAIKKLLSVAVLLLAIGLAGYFAFDHYFINAVSELDAKTPEEQEEILVSSEDYQDLEEVVALKKQVEAMEKGMGAAAEKENEAAASPSGILSKAAIENNLRTKLNSLQAEYTGRLNGLAGQAKSEYVGMRSKKAKVNLDALANKYIGLAGGLEGQCDARVYAAIAYAENQLELFNYESSMPGQARRQYQTIKAQRRKSMLSSIR